MFVPDPVDVSRNAAAAVTRRALARFILAARSYLRRPSISFFHLWRPRRVDVYPSMLGSGVEGLIAVDISFASADSPDNMWGIVRRTARSIEGLLKSLGFSVAYSSEKYVDDELRGVIVFLLEQRTRRLALRLGPPAWAGVHADRFIESIVSTPGSLGPWVTGEGRLAALVPSKLWDAVAVIRERFTRTVPASLLSRLESYRVVYGVEAAMIVEEVEPGWLAEIAGGPYWVRLRE